MYNKYLYIHICVVGDPGFRKCVVPRTGLGASARIRSSEEWPYARPRSGSGRWPKSCRGRRSVRQLSARYHSDAGAGGVLIKALYCIIKNKINIRIYNIYRYIISRCLWTPSGRGGPCPAAASRH